MTNYKPIEFYDNYGQSPKDGFATFSESGHHYFTYNKNGVATLISNAYASETERNGIVEKVTALILKRDNFKIVKKGLANYNLVLNDAAKTEICASRNYTSAIQANEVLFSFFELPKTEIPKSPYDTVTKKIDANVSGKSFNEITNPNVAATQNFDRKDYEALTKSRKEALVSESSTSGKSKLPLILLGLIPILCGVLLFRNCENQDSKLKPFTKKEVRKKFNSGKNSLNKAAEKAKAGAKNLTDKTVNNAKKITGSTNKATDKVVNKAKEYKYRAEKTAATIAKDEVKRDASGYEVGTIESVVYKCFKDPGCYAGKLFYWGEPKFANNSSRISPEAHKSIINLARMMKKNPNMRLTIAGNSLNNEDEYKTNEGLSSARANAMKNLLKANGAPDDRIYAYGNGQGNYINYDANKKADYQNKRLDITLDSK